MSELGHILQFFAFSLGLLAIYICFQFYRKNTSGISNNYLQILIGINLIVFVHVFEAFYRLIFSEDRFISDISPILQMAVLPIGLVRIWISYLVLRIALQITKKQTKIAPVYIILAAIFIVLRTFIFFNSGHMQQLMKLSSFLAQSILFISVLVSISLCFSRLKFIRSNHRPVVLFALVFWGLYSGGLFTARLINIATEHSSAEKQMMFIAVWNLLFNISHVIFLPKVFSLINPKSFGKTELMKQLTRREKEIVELIIKGRTNKEIAEQLYISHLTVREHCSNIFRKARVKNRTQLTGVVLYNT